MRENDSHIMHKRLVNASLSESRDPCLLPLEYTPSARSYQVGSYCPFALLNGGLVVDAVNRPSLRVRPTFRIQH
jgi:hypothetical protein